MKKVEKRTKYAPVACFCYNRVDHLLITLKALLKCPEAKKTDLFIFSDGARNIADIEKVNNLRKSLKKIKNFQSISIIHRKTNYGLALNLIDGIDRIVNQYGQVIVLEDDVVVEKCFLTFMNKALNTYEPIKKIFTISACISCNAFSNDNEVLFSEMAGCWGWAIWKDRWELYEKNTEKSFNELSDMKFRERLNIGNRVNISWMIDATHKGERNCWECYLNYTSVKYNLLNVYPPKTIITNIGQDGTGIHGAQNEVKHGYNLDVSKLKFPTSSIKETLYPILLPLLDNENSKNDIIYYNQNIYRDKLPKKRSKLSRIIRIIKGKE